MIVSLHILSYIHEYSGYKAKCNYGVSTGQDLTPRGFQSNSSRYNLKVLGIMFFFFPLRNSQWRGSIKKAILNYFAMFTKKHLCWSLFFNKFAGLLKRDSSTCVFS